MPAYIPFKSFVKTQKDTRMKTKTSSPIQLHFNLLTNVYIKKKILLNKL